MSDAKHLFKDLGAVVFSLAIAIGLAGTGLIERLLTSSVELRSLGSLFAGMFFTSVFTTAPAIVALGEVAQAGSVWTTAALGAVGAVLGDLLIFTLVRDKLSEHLMGHLKDSRGWLRFTLLVRSSGFRWISFFIGGLIIASPFPDELGISLLGFSKMRTAWFVPLSYVFNFAGILAIGAAARAIA